MTSTTGPGCDHARPDRATQRAVLATATAILQSDPEAAEAAAQAAPCGVCLGVCAIQFGFALAATLSSSEPFITPGGPVHRQLTRAVGAAQAELDAAQN
jgi:hypothetical protein